MKQYLKQISITFRLFLIKSLSGSGQLEDDCGKKIVMAVPSFHRTATQGFTKSNSSPDIYVYVALLSLSGAFVAIKEKKNERGGDYL